MRKNLYLGLIACAALTMTGCSNNEVIENAAQQSGKAIQFSTYLGKSVQGRAQDLTSSSIKDFGVFASYSAGNAWGTGEQKMNFMFDQKVKKRVVESTTTWEYTPLKYWPEKDGEMISFFAYAPYFDRSSESSTTNAITQKSTNDQAGAPQVTFTITNNAKQMVDFTSCVIMNKATQDNEAEVTFNFKHELARVNFAAKLNYDAYGEAAANKTKVNIKSIKLVEGGDFYLKADYTFATTDGNLGTWSNHIATATALDVTPIMKKSAAAEMGGYETEGVLVPTTASVDLFTSGEYLFLIPKSGATDNVTVEIAYDIVTVDTALEAGHVVSSATKRVTIAGSQFVQGVAKKYTFTIGLHEIKVDTPQVEAWSETPSDATPGVNGANAEPTPAEP